MSNQKVTLGYWSIRGLGERCRLLLNYVEMQYQDVRYTSLASGQWFQKKKPQLEKLNPAINLPYLIDGDKVIAESDAVLTYIVLKAKKPQLLGRNCEEQTWVATVMGIFRDLYRCYTSDMIYHKNPLEQTMPVTLNAMRIHLKKLNEIIGDKDYICGGITYVDFVIAQGFQHFCLLEPNFVQQFDKLSLHLQRIWKLPQISKYVNSPRFCERPVNYSPYAKWV